MGGQTFSNTSHGKTAEQAFEKAVQDARYEYGHRGYTGTLAEKDSFVLFTLPEGVSASQAEGWCRAWGSNKDKVPTEHHALITKMHKVYDDKWGPAVCVKVGEDNYQFFGWASS